MRLDGKSALVTGAGSGMGAATARLFAREGAKVVVADILEETGQHSRGEGRPAMLYRYKADAETEVKTRRLFP